MTKNTFVAQVTLKKFLRTPFLQNTFDDCFCTECMKYVKDIIIAKLLFCVMAKCTIVRVTFARYTSTLDQVYSGIFYELLR